MCKISEKRQLCGAQNKQKMYNIYSAILLSSGRGLKEKMRWRFRDEWLGGEGDGWIWNSAGSDRIMLCDQQGVSSFTRPLLYIFQFQIPV